jgi:thiamine pyrophosphokinase
LISSRQPDVEAGAFGGRLDRYVASLNVTPAIRQRIIEQPAKSMFSHRQRR